MSKELSDNIIFASESYEDILRLQELFDPNGTEIESVLGRYVIEKPATVFWRKVAAAIISGYPFVTVTVPKKIVDELEQHHCEKRVHKSCDMCAYHPRYGQDWNTGEDWVDYAHALSKHHKAQIQWKIHLDWN